MKRKQLLEMIGHSGGTLKCECMGMKYVFKFSAKAHVVGSRTLYELGKQKGGALIVLDPETKNTVYLGEEGPVFINSSFQQMIQTFDALTRVELPRGASSLERVELVKRQMERIDENCFLARDNFWTPLIWEIEYGVL